MVIINKGVIMNELNNNVETKRNYTDYGIQGENFNSDLTCKDIAKIARQQLKKKFPNCKFSVRIENYSGGSSMHLSLMSADFNPFINKVDKKALDLNLKPIVFINKVDKNKLNGMDERQESMNINRLTEAIEKGSLGINHYSIKKSYEDYIANGGLLTAKAKRIMHEAIDLIQSYNYDDSDGMIDYFDTNFYFHPTIGKYDKPFQIKK